MSPSAALLTFGVFVAIVATAWVLVDVFVLSYRPMTSKQRSALSRSEISHYVPSKHFAASSAGTVTVTPQLKRHVLGPGIPLRKRAMAYLYVGRNGRGGVLNHGWKTDPSHVRIDIDGADFARWLGDRPARYRRWDGAIAVEGTYAGPGRVSSPVSPRSDRAPINKHVLSPAPARKIERRH